MGTVAKSIDETEIKLGVRSVSEGWSIKQGYPISLKIISKFVWKFT